jgi:ATP-dependent Lon protease
MTQTRDGATAPSSNFPLLPLRTGVLFPGTIITLPIGRERSAALAQTLQKGSVLALAVQRDPRQQDPERADLYPLGTFARVHEVTRLKDRTYRLVLEGLGRFRLGELVQRDPFWTAEGEPVEETTSDAAAARVLADSLREHVEELATQAGGSLGALGAEDNPGKLADAIASGLGLPTDREMEVLAELDVTERLRLVARLVAEARELGEVRRKIDAEVRKGVNKGQREALLREQLRAIQKELGSEEGEGELDSLRKRLDEAGLTEEARKVADRELKRLEAMSPNQAEHGVIRTYLDWLAELPWSKRAPATDDLESVAQRLDQDHHGLGDVKQRILEHMAVLKLSGNPKGTILCLAGPPGVGKTSLGQSIADATGRPLVRIALGGVRDEAELRGHRRTYVGALPGRIVHAMKKAKVRNPVVLLDEIDKLAHGWQGNPEAALLEILDPEQNKTFLDHYLELPFDLSEALFVCTANSLETLSPPLRDRLEIIEVSGYTLEEKQRIAREHLIPRQLKAHAVAEGMLTVTDGALTAIIRDYTREAGVRQLTRELTKLCRQLALQITRQADGKAPPMHVDEAALAGLLGKPRFFADVAERTSVPGVATGLAWTPVGGDILFIETSRMPGKGRLEITGQLGDVMKESARAALTFVRSNAERLGVDPAFLEDQDLHIHVPAGAVPKDGPSAGVTIFTALASLLSGRRVRPDTAMTGECTLRGRVLPVGGIKAKVLAAHRAGLTRVILPRKNERDVADVPAEAREAMEFIFADDMAEVLAAALEATPAPAGLPFPAAEAAGPAAHAAVLARGLVWRSCPGRLAPGGGSMRN